MSSSALDLDAQEQSVQTVIDKYNELVEWLDSNPYTINPSLKADLFKEMDSNVLAGIMSNTSAVQEETPGTRVDGEAGSQSRQADPFSPQVSGTSDFTMESSLSKIGLTLNTDGTLDVEENFSQQFKTDFSRAYDALAGEEGFFTKIGSALDTLNSRDNRFNVYTRSDNNNQIYTRGVDAQVRNIYRSNITSLLNIFA
jgi:flagellar capping protein FliD